MKNEEFDQYVKDRYQGQMNYFKAATWKNQKKYKQIQWILIVLSSLTPVLAFLELNLDNGWTLGYLQYSVVIISALVAILTTGMKTFQYQELWVTYRATYELLKPEIHYYNFDVGPYGEEGIDKETLFITRVETILGNNPQGWQSAKKLSE